MDSPTVRSTCLCIDRLYQKFVCQRVVSFVKNRFIIWLSRLQDVTDVTDFVTDYNYGIHHQFKIWTFFRI